MTAPTLGAADVVRLTPEQWSRAGIEVAAVAEETILVSDSGGGHGREVPGIDPDSQDDRRRKGGVARSCARRKGQTRPCGRDAPLARDVDDAERDPDGPRPGEVGRTAARGRGGAFCDRRDQPNRARTTRVGGSFGTPALQHPARRASRSRVSEETLESSYRESATGSALPGGLSRWMVSSSKSTSRSRSGSSPTRHSWWWAIPRGSNSICSWPQTRPQRSVWAIRVEFAPVGRSRRNGACDRHHPGSPDRSGHPDHSYPGPHR